MDTDCDDTMKKGYSEQGFENSLRIRRNRAESLIVKPRHIYSDPPWVAKQLAFTVERQKDKVIDLTRKIENTVRKRQFNEAEDFIKELKVMIKADPRLGDLLRKKFLKLLIQLLKNDENPKLQIHAATIFQPLVVCPSNEDVIAAIKHLTPVVVNLVRSQEFMVRLQALWLLCNLIPSIPKDVLEEALVPLHLALPALLKLINSDILTILTSASWGLALLCNGREEMVVDDEYFDCLVERLLDLINADSRTMISSGLHVMGSIVRGGSDDAIEVIIKKEDTLASLMCLLEEVDMFYVKQACWIISNITARKEEHIKAVIDCKLIDPLFNVVQNHNLVDVKKEALWTISNAMCGVGPDQIECLRNSCSKVLWDELLESFSDDSPLLLVTLEGFANMKLMEVTCDDRPIDAAELHYIFKKIVDHSEWFTRYKILHRDDNAQISDGGLKYHLLFKFQGQQPHISLSCDYSENKIKWEFELFTELVNLVCGLGVGCKIPK